jgi:hypothetical protein
MELWLEMALKKRFQAKERILYPMKKLIAIVLSALTLIACLFVARWAQGNTKVDAPATEPTTTVPTTAAPTLPDIENGLGWG